MAQSSVLEIPLDDDLLKVLSSESRREIMRALTERRMTGTELATRLSLGKPAVSEHLKKLHECGLVERHDDSERRWVYFSLTQRGKDILEPKRTRFILMLAITVGALMLGLAAGMALYGLADGGGPIGVDSTPTAATSPDDSEYPTESYVIVKRDDVDLESGTINGPYQVVEGTGAPPRATTTTNPEPVPAAAQVDSGNEPNSPNTSAAPEPAATPAPTTAAAAPEPTTTSSGGFQPPFDPATLPANLTASNHTVLATPTAQPRAQGGPVQTPGSTQQRVEVAPEVNTTEEVANATQQDPAEPAPTAPATCTMTQGVATINIPCPATASNATEADHELGPMNGTQSDNGSETAPTNATTAATETDSSPPAPASNATLNATAVDPPEVALDANLTLPTANLTTHRPAAATSSELPAAPTAPAEQFVNATDTEPAIATAPEPTHEASVEPPTPQAPAPEVATPTTTAPDLARTDRGQSDAEGGANAGQVQGANHAAPTASSAPSSDSTLLPVTAIALALLASLIVVRRRS